MSLAPKFIPSHIYKASSSTVPANVHRIQLFLDYDCPFSAILFFKFYKSVIPETEKLYPGKFQFVFYNVPQPWHPTSSLLHEVSLAVAAVAPSKFWDYSNILFENQSQFFDTETYDETRKETYQRLIDLATPLGIEAAELWNFVEIKASDSSSNAGNLIGKDFKYFIRLHRTIGVHVTPTIAINGILNTSLESSTSVDDYLKVFGQQLES